MLGEGLALGERSGDRAAWLVDHGVRFDRRYQRREAVVLVAPDDQIESFWQKVELDVV